MRQRTTKFTAEPGKTCFGSAISRSCSSFTSKQKCIDIVDWRGDVVVQVLNMSRIEVQKIAFAAKSRRDIWNALDAHHAAKMRAR